MPGVSVPMSPQSIDRAHRPVVNRPRVPPTSMFSSSGGPTVAVLAYMSSALSIASFWPNSGFMFDVSKKAPSFVPLAWSRPPAIEMIHQ